MIDRTRLQGEMNGDNEDVMKSLKWNIENDVRGSRTQWIRDYASELFMRGVSKQDFFEWLEASEDS